MEPEVTTPAAEPQGTPPQADPQEGELGSEPQAGIDLVTVPHPDLDGDEDGAQTDPQPPAEPSQDGARADQPADPPDPANPDGAPAPVATLRYRGQEYPVQTAEQLEQLASMGLDYGAKTQLAAPYVNFAKAMTALEKSDPQAAAQIKATLTGEAAPAPAAPGKNDEPLYMKGPDGSLVPVPDELVNVLDQLLERRGINPAAAKDPQTGELGQLREAVAPIVLNQQLDKCEAYVKDKYGRDDFKQAIPLIQQELAAAGIGQGDPRDTPQTWVNIYANLALGGKLQALDPKTTVKDLPDNKSGLKRGAIPPHTTSTPQTPPGWKAATEQALKSGSSKDLESAIGMRISHPDLEDEG